MLWLEAVSRSPEVSWYKLGGLDSPVQSWVVSTPQTISVCNDPLVLGVEYSDLMRRGMASALSSAPFGPLLRGAEPGQVCIMNFLRGSLNFGLREALWRATGSNVHPTCFMSSQRTRKEGKWEVREDMYRKINIPAGAVMLVGDVVATGTTVENGLQVIREVLKEQGTSLRGLVFFTIGGPRIEEILSEMDALFRQDFPDYQETHLVYLEGRFGLAEQDTPLTIAIPGTDLLRTGALLSPELERSQYDSLTAPLERCAIYDAGSRAFDVAEYVEDVVGYWEQVRRLSRRGRSLQEALRERWPEADYRDLAHLRAAKAQTWRGLDEGFVDALWAAWSRRWTPEFIERARTTKALDALASAHLARLHRVATGPSR
ncbi:MAG: hypothetical protein JXX28_11365 [Deltaproteobacteria bacterium]|nr:hypothetical protein [Deltaproteobacteria bacterium]